MRIGFRIRARPMTAVILASAVFSLRSARGEVSKETYARAEQMLGWKAAERVFNAPVDAHWIDDNRFWYRKRIPLGHEIQAPPD